MRVGFLFSLIALLFLAACTQAAPAATPIGASVVAITDLVNCYPGPVDLLEYPRSTAIPEPNTYCGTVTVNCAPVAYGTIVEAVVGGTVCDTVQATGGWYRATVVSPHCGKPGDIVYFRVAGRWAPQAGRVMIPFMGWALDLSVGSEGAPTSTPIPRPS